MQGQKFLLGTVFLIITGALLWSGCDELVTETNNITVIDSTLGMECFSCHKDTDNPFLRPKGQYLNSRHYASLSLLDAIVTIDGSSFNVSNCGARCHTHEGFLKYLSVINVSDSAYSVIGCFTCHMPHTGTYVDWDPDTLRGLAPTVELNNGEFIKMGKSHNCVHCHQAVSSPNITQSVLLTAGWGPHYSPQTDLVTGSGGYFVDFDRDENPHLGDTITGGCIDCHYGTTGASGQGYQFGEHTFRLQDILGNDTTFFVDNCGLSSSCHDGSTADEITHFYDIPGIDTIRTKINNLEQVLKNAGILDNSDPEGLKIITSNTIKPEEARILYNYLLIRYDGTEGIHNPQYVRLLLDSSLTRWDSIPRASFTFIQTDSCVPFSVDFTDASAGSLTSYQWSFGDGGTSSTMGSVSHNYVDGGTYTVTLIVSGSGGEDSLTGVIKAYEFPTASFSAIATSDCDSAATADSLVVAFTDETAEGTTGQSWVFGDGSSVDGNNPIHIYRDPDSSYTVTYTAVNPCGTDDTTVILYTFNPTAEFSTSDSTVSIGFVIHFNDESIGANSWYWEFGDDSTSVEQNPIHAYQTAGTYSVSLTVGNVCKTVKTTKTDLITVQ